MGNFGSLKVKLRYIQVYAGTNQAHTCTYYIPVHFWHALCTINTYVCMCSETSTNTVQPSMYHAIDRPLSQVGARRKRCPGQFGQDSMGSIPATPSTKHASCFPPSSMPASIEISIKLIVCLPCYRTKRPFFLHTSTYLLVLLVTIIRISCFRRNRQFVHRTGFSVYAHTAFVRVHKDFAQDCDK
jgi:hypothetical protein